MSEHDEHEWKLFVSMCGRRGWSGPPISTAGFSTVVEKARLASVEQERDDALAVVNVVKEILAERVDEGEDGGWYVPPSSVPGDEGDDYADDTPSALRRLWRETMAGFDQGWRTAGNAEAELEKAQIAMREAIDVARRIGWGGYPEIQMILAPLAVEGEANG